MKTLSFNTNSWHWFIAHEMGNYVPTRHGSDLCAYTRRVILGSIKLIGFAVIVGFLVAAFGFLFWNVIFGIIFSIITHSWFFTDIGEGGVFVTGFFISVGLVYILGRIVIHSISRGVKAVSESAKDQIAKKPDSFAANAYNAWHDKFCAKLEFVDNEDDE